MPAPHGLTPAVSLVLAILALALPAASRADVTIQQKTVTLGLGGFGDGTREQTLIVAGDKSRSDEVFTYTGLMKTAAGGPRRSSTITRIDLEVLWRVDDDEKQFTETSFAEMNGAHGAETADEHEHGHSHEIAMDFTADVRRTGKKQNVNGFAAEQVIVTLTGTPKDPKPGADATMTFTLEQWLSTAVPGAEEVREHSRLMAEKLGMDPGLQRLAGSAMGSYSGPLRELGAKLEDLKGFPVRMILTIESTPRLAPERKVQLDQARTQAAASGTAGKPKWVGVTTAYTATTDVVSITLGPSTASFEVPAGYMKSTHAPRMP